MIWIEKLDEHIKSSTVPNPPECLICIGGGRIPRALLNSASASALKAVWVDANPEIQQDNEKFATCFTDLELLTSAVSSDGGEYPFYRHNFDVLDGLLSVRQEQTRYPNLRRGSDAPVSTLALSTLLRSIAKRHVALVLDLNGASASVLASLEAADLERIRWIAVAIADVQLFDGAHTLDEIACWAATHNMLNVGVLSERSSKLQWWVGVPNDALIAAKREHEEQLKLVRQQANSEREQALESLRAQADAQIQSLNGALESASLERQKLADDFAVSGLSIQRIGAERDTLARQVELSQAELKSVAIYLDHQKELIGELEIELEEACAREDALHARLYGLACESGRYVAEINSLRNKVLELTRELDEFKENGGVKSRLVENELTKAQAQIGLLRDFLGGRTI